MDYLGYIPSEETREHTKITKVENINGVISVTFLLPSYFAELLKNKDFHLSAILSDISDELGGQRFLEYDDDPCVFTVDFGNHEAGSHLDDLLSHKSGKSAVVIADEVLQDNCRVHLFPSLPILYKTLTPR